MIKIFPPCWDMTDGRGATQSPYQENGRYRPKTVNITPETFCTQKIERPSRSRTPLLSMVITIAASQRKTTRVIQSP